MFNLFSKPVGVYVRDRAVTAVLLKKEGDVPSVEKEIHFPLEPGIVVDGLIARQGDLLKALLKVKQALQGSECVVAVPVNKTYTSFLRFPASLDEKTMAAMVKQQIPSLLPASLNDLYYEQSVISDGSKGNLVFIGGVEKTVLDSYKSVFQAAGWTKVSFVTETLALARAIPLKFSEYPHLMFIHSFGDRVLLGSVYKGHAFDGEYSSDLKTDFLQSFNSFVQQLGHAPSHIVLSGDKASLAVLSQLKFGGPKPKFVSARFAVEVEGKLDESSDLIIATGLSMAADLCDKKSGRCLINLLD